MIFKTLEEETGYSVFTVVNDEVVEIGRLIGEAERQACVEKVATLTAASGSDLVADFERSIEGLGDLSDTTVTFLVDNSGSMRRGKMEQISIAVMAMTKALEKRGINSEVLGYTTVGWKGAPSYKEWIADGKPKAIRLSAVRHIIYKEPNTSCTQAQDDIAGMLSEELLKENLDNEALIWAYRRLDGRQEQNKILVLLTDELRPICDATMAYDIGGVLVAHHKAVVKTIESSDTIAFIPIGVALDRKPQEIPSFYKEMSAVAESADEIVAACGRRVHSVMIDRLENTSSFKR